MFEIIPHTSAIKWVKIYEHHRVNMRDIMKWCADHQCGKRINLNCFSFKSDEELTLFLLRWQTEIQ